jgi:hypothetical protein
VPEQIPEEFTEKDHREKAVIPISNTFARTWNYVYAGVMQERNVPIDKEL